MPRVVFRADAGRAIGSGHVMRSLALAAEFSSGGWAVGFAANAETFASVKALAEQSIEKSILSDERENEAAALVRRWPAGVDVLVVDHYGRDAAFERACRPWAKRIVAIDDLADRPHDTDVLIDGAGTVSAYGGLVPEDCTVLAGSSYAIVAPAFRRARRQALQRRGQGAVERVLVSFGQIDAPNATTMALTALRTVGFGGKVDVALGGTAPHLAAAGAVAGLNVQIHVDATDMARLMSEADLAVGAGGVTAWERCCVGLPSILLTVADNQLGIAKAVSGSGAGLDAGPMGGDADQRLIEPLRVLLTDAERRNKMAEAAAALVDGRGAERAWLSMIEPHVSASGRSVMLRLAAADDEAWLLALQSQPETRRFANDPTLPSVDGHRRWFAQTLAEPARLLMVAEADGKRAAMLRIDKGDVADRISIAVDPAYYRQGVGVAVLALAARLRPRRVLEAEVLPGNKASLALFAGAGYRQVDEQLFRREPA
jgi:UDP-2,4-diacetamido-2,4,6-trideoxy-beta-L-altropyranose hydrolase